MRNRYSSKKKLGVLVSSLALAAVTAMAGVTGTAAWFTATRRVTATVSAFTAVNPSGNLTITASSGIGTAVTSGTTTVTAATPSGATSANTLTDASYDITNHELYSDYVSESNAATAFEDVSSHLTLSTISGDNTATYQSAGTISGNSYFYAFTWSYTFSMASDNSGKDSYVFFDPANSTIPDTTDIAEGFRIAIDSTTAGATAFDEGASGQSDGHAMIFSKASVTEGNNYIIATTGTTVSYADVTKYYAADGTTVYRDGLALDTVDGYGNYLGTINASTSITVFFLPGSKERIRMLSTLMPIRVLLQPYPSIVQLPNTNLLFSSDSCGISPIRRCRFLSD